VKISHPRVGDQSVFELIDCICAAGEDPRQWEVFLERLRRQARSTVGILLLGAAFCPPALALGASFEVLYNFQVEAGTPQSSLIQAADGNFYGTSFYGGAGDCAGGCGAIFKMNSAGDLTVLHAFAGYPNDGAQPTYGKLLQAADGNFYGTTSHGGAFDLGTVFKMNSAGSLSILHNFAGSPTDGSVPTASLIQASDGYLYGTTHCSGVAFACGDGKVFRMDLSGNLTVIHSFSGADGSGPFAGLLQAADENFYGTTSSGGQMNDGTIFKMDSSGALTTLHSFSGGDGGGPYAGLIQAADGNFYGTTPGTIFKLESSGVLTTIHVFAGGPNDGAFAFAGLIQATDGNFYGTTHGGACFPPLFTRCPGTVFRMDTSGNFALLYKFKGGRDGASPVGGLLQAADCNFYGTTTAGPVNYDLGTVFRMDSTGSLTTLRVLTLFQGGSPEAGLIQAADGNFYGTTSTGGAFEQGTVFKMDSAANVAVLHAFTGSDGSFPRGGLVQASDGNLYGTTPGGGANCLPAGCGTVFRMDTMGNLTTLHNFAGPPTDGLQPLAGLIQATDGNLYGTTYGGGASFSQDGTVFKIDTAGNLTVLHNFTGSDGSGPYDSLIQGLDGFFYGTTLRGGASGNGTVFKMDSSGNLTTLRSFAVAPDGSFPHGLIQAADGNFYGVTSLGGTGSCNLGCGTVFKMDSKGALTVLHSFTGSDGRNPQGALTQTAAGNFYGVTSAGGTGSCNLGCGTVFRMDSSGNLTTLHNFIGGDGFTAGDGANPLARVIEAADGRFYGTASMGGSTSGQGFGGVIFRLTDCVPPPPPPVATNDGPICEGQTLHLMASAVSGATYSWSGPNGFASSLQNPSITNATEAASGTYGVTVTVAGCTSQPATTVATVNALPSAALTAPASACPNMSGLTASVPDAGAGANYSWSITNGTVTAGAGTRSITFGVGGAGSVGLSVAVTDSNACTSNDSVSIHIEGVCFAEFYTLTPCRVADTRNPNGSYGGPAIAPGPDRTFVIVGQCGIPVTARAVSINVTITQPGAPGDLGLYPGGSARPLVSTMSYWSGQTRADNAVLPLGPSGDLMVHCDQGSGTVQLIIDTNGYFQ
jgi:uncharacterized repeat protein (TIGR03803 family)